MYESTGYAAKNHAIDIVLFDEMVSKPCFLASYSNTMTIGASQPSRLVGSS